MRLYLLTLATALPLAIASTPRTSAAKAGAVAEKIDFEQQVRPVLATYCAPCHNGVRPKAALDLEGDRGQRPANLDLWRAVADSVEGGDMPPPDRPQPSSAQAELLLRWSDQVRRAGGAAGGSTPLERPVTLRRLNRAEYRYAVHDLLGQRPGDLDPAGELPGDDVGHGFDNLGEVLTTSPLLVERYLAAAERIAARAIVGHPDAPRRRHSLRLRQASLRRPPRLPSTGDAAAEGGAAAEAQERLMLITSARPATAQHEFPVDAEYELQVVVSVPPSVKRRTRDAGRLVLRVDGRTIESFALAAIGEQPSRRTVRAYIDRGRSTVELALVDGRPGQARLGGGGVATVAVALAGAEVGSSEAFAVEAARVDGPLPGTHGPLPASHTRIIFQPPGSDSWRDSRTFLARLASRAYRRPASTEEVERLAALVDAAVAEGDTFERGMQRALQAVLISPSFLFRIERDDGAGGGLTPHQLASRLSFFLWSSLPDDELASHAGDGSLRRPEVLAAQVRRMLADSRAERLAETFAPQWLQLGALAAHRPSPQQFPSFDDELRAAMLEETRLFFAAVVREDLRLATFVDADFTFLNERLARHYGLTGVGGPAFRKVMVAGTSRGGGLLGQASVLTATSMATRTSPVRRGRWIMETLLGSAAVPPPPGPVPELSAHDRAAPSCARCHRKMDPLGVALENFDAVGAWRDSDQGIPVDARGVLPAGAVTGPAGLRSLLASRIRSFRRALAARLLSYALGRGPTPYDRPVVERICDETAAGGDTFSALVLAVTRSAPFLASGGEAKP